MNVLLEKVITLTFESENNSQKTLISGGLSKQTNPVEIWSLSMTL